MEEVKCNRCNNIVSKSVLEEYTYSCDYCDEDLYEFETYRSNSIVKEKIKKYNDAKEVIEKSGLEIRDYDIRTSKERLVKDGRFAGYLDLKNNYLELIYCNDRTSKRSKFSWPIETVELTRIVEEFYVL
ncbi:hypothetical protein BSK59_13160 [Paenibacillus odorifer]|uniref:hypothetical protein n=1 Tax=Paenibacillus odorifer TaxID=189426 RepID=UPI00096E38B9|nr:hypothetical protein [Paenibacillus odorifer]OME55421.1 hypothetical protein BSK59_13160 [Paenibacillus odorifer]